MPNATHTVRRTFLFTDIEGSTRLWDAFPGAMLAALDQHDQILSDAVTQHGGLVHRHTGDGMVAVFTGPPAAIDAAIQAQRALAAADWHGVDAVKVRMGVHSGEVVERGEELHGWALNVASRVHALAHGGQLVVSGSALPDAGARLDQPVQFVDLGLQRLRDIARPLRIYSVVCDGLPERFDGLRDSARPVPAMPRPLTSFVGRTVLVERVTAQVRSHRLVTLCGVAGVGKTRVALEVASRLTDEFHDGVVLCELAGVDPDRVGAALAAALGIERRSSRSPEDSVLEWLHGKEVLLILDNCEEAPAAVGQLAAAVATQAPRTRVLATGREPLRTPGEHVSRVHPFGVEDDMDDGVRLFGERARSAGAEVSDDPASRSVAWELCEAVAGVPLAIELAASNATSLSLLDLLDAIRAGDLPGTGSDGEPRSVDDALELTVERLDAASRAALLRCSVFAGSFDRAAFAAVAAPEIPSVALLRMLRDLVDRSLVVSETRRERTRFRLLEPVRAFAFAALPEAEATAAQRRFIDHYAGVAVASAEALRGPDEARWVGQLQLDFDNLRAAQSRALDAGDANPAMCIVASLWDFAFMRMRSEIFDWSEDAVLAATTDHPLLAEVLGVAALGGWIHDNPRSTQSYVDSALAAEQAADLAPTLPVRLAIMNSVEYGGMQADIRPVMAEVLALSKASASPYWQTNADVVRSLGHSFAGRSGPALDLAHHAMEIARTSGNPSTVAWALFGRGVATEAGDPEFAETLFDDALARARSVENRWVEAMCLTRLCSLQRRRGAVRDAMVLVQGLLDTWERAGHRAHLWAAVRQAALCLADGGDLSSAVILEETVQGGRLVPPGLPADADDLRSAMGRIAADVAVEDVRRWRRRADGLDQADAVRLARDRLEVAIGG
jgi:predicted ATPase/class 3 adenylate cyclase